MTENERGPVEGETYADSKERTAEFQALLEKYDNDWDRAVEAQRRGERADPGDRSGDSAMPQ
jgi:hypothetical protein